MTIDVRAYDASGIAISIMHPRSRRPELQMSELHPYHSGTLIGKADPHWERILRWEIRLSEIAALRSRNGPLRHPLRRAPCGAGPAITG